MDKVKALQQAQELLQEVEQRDVRDAELELALSVEIQLLQQEINKKRK